MDNELAAIPVASVSSPGFDPQRSGNALPILHEIRHALRQLAATGQPTLIDLRALPFGPGDEEQLLAALGRGEVKVTLDALGPTQVWETRYAGVWVLDHYNADNERIALTVEVTRIPDILPSQQIDIESALAQLEAALQPAEPDTPGSPQPN